MAPDVASALASLGRREHWVGEDDLVFVGETGGYLDGSALRRRYKKALSRASLRPLRFHDLRHTFGTRMIAKADIRRVQEWMGHADIQTTMRYLHYAPRGEDAQLVADAFRVSLPAGEGVGRVSPRRPQDVLPVGDADRLRLRALERSRHSLLESSLGIGGVFGRMSCALLCVQCVAIGRRVGGRLRRQGGGGAGCLVSAGWPGSGVKGQHSGGARPLSGLSTTLVVAGRCPRARTLYRTRTRDMVPRAERWSGPRGDRSSWPPGVQCAFRLTGAECDLAGQARIVAPRLLLSPSAALWSRVPARRRCRSDRASSAVGSDSRDHRVHSSAYLGPRLGDGCACLCGPGVARTARPALLVNPGAVIALLARLLSVLGRDTRALLRNFSRGVRSSAHNRICAFGAWEKGESLMDRGGRSVGVVLAVGRTLAAASPARGLVWSVDPTPIDGPTGVSCVSARACTAVNGVGVAGWNGRRWRREAAPRSEPADSSLAGVSCTSTKRCGLTWVRRRVVSS